MLVGCIPAAAPAEGSTRPRDAAPGAAAAATILVVDDNASKRMALRAMLAPLGHEVVEADSGRAALRAVLRQNFAVILMDVRMPTMDGYETAKLIRQRGQSELTPIIFFTAYGRDETETATAYANGAVDFIFAPVLADVLRAKVSTFVDLFVQSQELQGSLESITRLNAALRESEVRARAVLQNVADGIVTAGERGLIESFNQSARRLFGYREDEVIGRPLQLDHRAEPSGDFADPARARWSLLIGEDIPAEPIETVGTRKDGSCFPMEMDMSQMEIGGRHVHDRLHPRHLGPQGVYRGARAPDAARRAHRTPEPHAVRRSHGPGDRDADRADEPRGMLSSTSTGSARSTRRSAARTATRAQEVAERLHDALRESDTVARLGDDEFAILPSGETDVEAAAAIAWKVREAFGQPFAIGGKAVEPRSASASPSSRSTAARRRPDAPGRSGDARGQAVRRRARRLHRRARGRTRAG